MVALVLVFGLLCHAAVAGDVRDLRRGPCRVSTMHTCTLAADAQARERPGKPVQVPHNQHRRLLGPPAGPPMSCTMGRCEATRATQPRVRAPTRATQPRVRAPTCGMDDALHGPAAARVKVEPQHDGRGCNSVGLEVAQERKHMLAEARGRAACTETHRIIESANEAVGSRSKSVAHWASGLRMPSPAHGLRLACPVQSADAHLQ